MPVAQGQHQPLPGTSRAAQGCCLGKRDRQRDSTGRQEPCVGQPPPRPLWGLAERLHESHFTWSHHGLALGLPLPKVVLISEPSTLVLLSRAGPGFRRQVTGGKLAAAKEHSRFSIRVILRPVPAPKSRRETLSDGPRVAAPECPLIAGMLRQPIPSPVSDGVVLASRTRNL